MAKGLSRLRAAFEEGEQVRPAAPPPPPALRRLPPPQPIRLADAFPELFAGLCDAERDDARQRAVARRIDLPRGALLRAAMGVQLVVDGTLARACDGRSASVGRGAIVRATDGHWRAVQPATVAVLDGSLLRALCRWPALVEALLVLSNSVLPAADAAVAS
jgi:hypothetical protein